MVTLVAEEDTGITTRERQILGLIACGLSAKEIAQQIGIGPRTVERHIENARHKLRARNKTHLIAKAIASGDLRLDTAPLRPASPVRGGRPLMFE